MTREELLKVAKPILFNTEMVRTISDGRKAATRRVIKPQLPPNIEEIHNVDPIGYLMFKTTDRYLDGWQNRKARYQVGDILYVRETGLIQSMKNFEKKVKILFKADNKLAEFNVSDKEYARLSKYEYPKNKWLSPYWLTKETTRIFLRVTGVRAERLQDINGTGIENEGIKTNITHFKSMFNNFGNSDRFDEAIKKFSALWDGTIKKKDLDRYGWEANPWVWVYEFERVSADESL